MNVNQQYKELLTRILKSKESYTYLDKKRDVLCKQIDSHTLDIDLTKGFPAINLKKLYWRGVVGELIWFLRGDTNIKYLVDNNINIWNKDAFNHSSKHTKWNSMNNFIKEVSQKGGSYHGELGRIYGAQWRNWSGQHEIGELTGNIYHNYIDQISNLITNLKEQPMSRRHIVTAWNPAELDDMALPPCHWSFEIIVKPLDDIICVDGITKASTCNHLMCNKDPKFCSADFGSATNYGFTLKWHQRSVDTFLGR